MGVAEHNFEVPLHGKSVTWHLYDVGGARGQRHTWIPYFDDANAIIFVAPVSAFDQVRTTACNCNALSPSVFALPRCTASGGPSLRRSSSHHLLPSFQFSFAAFQQSSPARFRSHLSLISRSLRHSADDEIKQYLEEDPRTNRIDDSLQLFTAICSNRLLKGVHLVLFLSAYLLLVPRARLSSS